MVYRKRFKRYDEPGAARFITFSCYLKLPLLAHDGIKSRFIEKLDRARDQFEFNLIAWVIMNNHVHMVLAPGAVPAPKSDPADPIGKALDSLKQSVAQSVIRRWRSLDADILDHLKTPQGTYRFWQTGGGYDRVVRADGELMEKIKYVHLNPIRAGLVSSPLDYPWSSARYHESRDDAIIACDLDFL